MTPETVMTIAQRALEMTVLLAAPLLLVALAIGLLVGIFQAATQIHEMTLSFIPKLIGMAAALVIAGPWMIKQLVSYTRLLIESIPSLIGGAADAPMPVYTYSQIESWIGIAFWPFLRIGACLMVAPLFGASYVPPRVRIVLAGAVTLVAVPLIPKLDGLTLLSADGVVTTVQQLVIGVAMGFALQLMFDALNLGGQLLANGMGLGLAFNIDPFRGVETPALGQLYVVLGTLTFIALDGHIALIETLVASFRGLPVGPTGFSPQALRSLADWGDQMVMGAVRIALPGMTALLVINLAFGVTSRAAPSLNLFAVGLPVTLVFGLVVIWLGLPSMQSGWLDLLNSAFQFLRALGGVG